jgi:hypothetical protein
MRLRFLQVTALLLMTLVSWSAKATVVDWEATRFADHQMALRCYLPDEVHQVRAIIVLVPGMNGDGRSMANDPEWMGLAQRNGCALIGCSIKGIQGAVYHEVVQWSGELFLSGIGELARMSNHPELENVPLGFWGHSAGGQWNYNFACWKPERTFAFIVNKGAYYQGVSSQAVRAIPSLWIAGGKDTDERIGNITSLYAENRRKGAAWGLLIEPEVNHAVGRSKEIGMAFLEEALSLRVDSDGHMHPVKEGAGWIGDFRGYAVCANPTSTFGDLTHAWFPGKSTAEHWRSISLPPPPSVADQAFHTKQP